MRINEILYSRGFNNDVLKMPAHIKEALEVKTKVFQKDPYDPRLRTHKLHGREREAWAFSVTWSYRVKFVFLSDDRAYFIAIGTHGIYD